MPRSFSNFIHAADDYLDGHGTPVAFRRHFIREWCQRSDGAFDGHPKQKLMQEGLSALKAAGLTRGYDALVHWYYDIYGELAYRPPFSALLGRVGKGHFFELRMGESAAQFLGPKTLVNESRVKSETQRLLSEATPTEGLFALRRLPFTVWTQMAAAEYDASLAALFASRPSYHLSMWSSHQAVEKILKAVLVAHGWQERQLATKVNHNLVVAASEIEALGFPFPPAALTALKRLSERCGPAVRYAEDYTEAKRIALRDKAWQAHRDLLQFAAASAEALRLAFMFSEQGGAARIISQEFLDLTEQVFKEFVARGIEGTSTRIPAQGCK